MVGDIKTIIVIESLSEERKTGEELYNDCIRRKIDLQYKNKHNYHSINCKNELFEIFKYYSLNADYFPKGILFHLEMHGDDNKKGLILSNNSLVTWEELVCYFRDINVKTKDKFFITMATCYGRYLYKGIDPYEKSPFSGYISARDAIYPNEIIDKYLILFGELIDNGNLVNAYLKMEKSGSNFYYKDNKTLFQDSFKSVIDKLYGKENLKHEITKNMELSEEKKELILKTVVNDLFVKQYNAFKFDD